MEKESPLKKTKEQSLAEEKDIFVKKAEEQGLTDREIERAWSRYQHHKKGKIVLPMECFMYCGLKPGELEIFSRRKTLAEKKELFIKKAKEHGLNDELIESLCSLYLCHTEKFAVHIDEYIYDIPPIMPRKRTLAEEKELFIKRSKARRNSNDEEIEKSWILYRRYKEEGFVLPMEEYTDYDWQPSDLVRKEVYEIYDKHNMIKNSKAKK